MAGLAGPYRVGNDLPGLVAGYMGTVPAAWSRYDAAVAGGTTLSLAWSASALHAVTVDGLGAVYYVRAGEAASLRR